MPAVSSVGTRALGRGNADEDRLLGRSSYQDAGAVPISAPMTRKTQQGQPLKVANHGGPRPQNSLNRNQLTSRPSQNTRTNVAQNQLEITTSRGNNVESHPCTNHLDDFTVPSAKRQKTSHQASSPLSGAPSEFLLDRLSPSNVHVGGLSQTSSRGASVHSQGSGVQISRSNSFLGGVSEHRSVENMMRSDPPTVKQKRRPNRRNQEYNGELSNFSLRLPEASDPLKCSGDADSNRTGTTLRVTTDKSQPATETANTSKKLQGPGSSKRSPYFDSAASPLTNGTRKKGSGRLDNWFPKPLSEQFVPVDGVRRDLTLHMSSDNDELAVMEPTVGRIADGRRSRTASPSKVLNPEQRATSPDALAGMEPSTIKHTTFSVKKEPRKTNKPRQSSAQAREEKIPWAIDLAAISRAGENIKGSGMALVRSDKEKCYVVMKGGKPTTLRIRTDKLQKIIWEESGGRVRFLSSKSGIEDNTLDLEFKNAKAAFDVVQKFQTESLCTNMSHPTEKMERLFERKRSEVQKSAEYVKGRSIEGENTQIAGAQRQHLESRLESAAFDSKVALQHRGSKGIVGELIARGLEGADESRPISLRKSTAERNAGIAARLDRLKPDHNSHLRRSTRTSGATNVYNGVLEDLDDPAEVERYSLKHSLGPEWKKPLTYPKVGKPKITVEWGDLPRLDEGEFLNDTLISFYLRFLQKRVEDERPDLSSRIHFFNTYFFATLTSANKSRKSFNYEGVQKWTRSVDIFTYDYIVVPINEASHWYLAIICNLPALDHAAAPEECNSSQTEAVELESLLPSNPIHQAISEETHAIRDQSEHVEKEATDSFAELTLENDELGPAVTDTVEPKPEDKEMLDIQLADNIEELSEVGDTSNEVLQRISQQADESVHAVEDIEKSAKALVKTKKQKRRSMPTPAVTNTDPNTPVIITFDSLGSTRSPAIKVLKDYLREEAKTKRGGMEIDLGQIKGINAKEIPLQSNFSDCGVFLLGYVAKFLENDPEEFIAKIIRREYKDHEDWPNLNPSIMRAEIRDHIQALHNTQVDEQRESAIISGKYKHDQNFLSSPTPAATGKAENKTIAIHAPASDAIEAAPAPSNCAGNTSKETATVAVQHPRSASPAPAHDMLNGLDIVARQQQLGQLAGNDLSNSLEQSATHDHQTSKILENRNAQIEAYSSPSSSRQKSAPTTSAKRRPLSELPMHAPDGASIVEIESQSQHDPLTSRDFKNFRSVSPNSEQIKAQLPSEIANSQLSDSPRLIPQVIVQDNAVRSQSKNRIASPRKPRRPRQTARISTLDALTGTTADDAKVKKKKKASLRGKERSEARQATRDEAREREVVEIDD